MNYDERKAAMAAEYRERQATLYALMMHASCACGTACRAMEEDAHEWPVMAGRRRTN